jgi:hypothetical protein
VIAWYDLHDPDLPRTLRDGDEVFRFLTHFSDRIHTTRITEVAIDDGGDVDIEDVSVFQDLVSSWHAVTDDVIERYAGGTLVGFLTFSPLIGSEIVDTRRYSPVF